MPQTHTALSWPPPVAQISVRVAGEWPLPALRDACNAPSVALESVEETAVAMLHLDGRSFSGSGTIVHFGVPLAALAGQDLHLTHIRARRDPPGLRPQHLTAVEAVTQVCQGSLEEGMVGSQELVFCPGGLSQGGHFRWDIGTAGATTMLALALLPVAAFTGLPSRGGPPECGAPRPDRDLAASARALRRGEPC